MSKNNKLVSYIIAIMFAVIMVYPPVLAKDLVSCNDASGAICSSNTKDLKSIAPEIVKKIAYFAGMIAVTMLVYAGYLYVRYARGDEPDKIVAAKNIITYTVVGLVVVIFAGAIIAFVIERIKQ